MQKGIVTRDDSVWQGHPDVTYFKDYFFVVFRQSEQHRAKRDTKIMITKSRNGIRYSNPICVSETEDRYNCPRLTVIDDVLWICCDCVKKSEDFIRVEDNEENTMIFLWCSKNGSDWSCPIETNITGILPDRICRTDDNHFLIATHTRKKEPKSTEGVDIRDFVSSGYLIQNVWKTNKSFLLPCWEKQVLADVPGLNLCEASICNADGELICLMRENSQKGKPCFWSNSKDHGDTWCPPVPTRFFGGHRPVLGQLSSGNFLTTYREQCFSHQPPFWAKNTFACRTGHKSMLNPDKPCVNSILLPIEHDVSPRADSGYTGWIEIEDKKIYVVNYVTNDAPKPYIVWYVINENEF